MKKRIGSILYDTDKSILVLEPDIYRKKNSFLFFRFDGNAITPLSREEAESIIKESCNTEAIKYLGYSDKRNRGLGAVAVDFEHLNHLNSYCRKNKVTQKEMVEGFIDTLPE